MTEEEFNPLKELKEIYETTSPLIPPFVVHSCSDPNILLPDGRPAVDSRVRKIFFVATCNLMSSAIRKKIVSNPDKITIFEDFHEKLSQEIAQRPLDLPDAYNGKVIGMEIRITPEDIAWASGEVIKFLSGTEFEIHQDPK